LLFCAPTFSHHTGINIVHSIFVHHCVCKHFWVNFLLHLNRELLLLFVFPFVFALVSGPLLVLFLTFLRMFLLLSPHLIFLCSFWCSCYSFTTFAWKCFSIYNISGLQNLVLIKALFLGNTIIIIKEPFHSTYIFLIKI
jgi:hypothetical protein